MINFPCGLGDCLMLTPTLREYYNTYGEKLGVAILGRLKSSQIFENNPYVGDVYYLDLSWYGRPFPQSNDPTANETKLKLTYLNQPLPTHKIHLNAGFFGLKLSSTHIDVFISENDIKIADEVINKFVGNNPYGFIQTETDQSQKNLPTGYGKKWLRQYRNLEHFIEIGDTIKYDEYSINVQFEILRRATAVCLPDSVFYHACSGLNKNIDFVYFNGGETYRYVRNLNDKIIENVFFEFQNID